MIGTFYINYFTVYVHPKICLIVHVMYKISGNEIYSLNKEKGCNRVINLRIVKQLTQCLIDLLETQLNFQISYVLSDDTK